MALIASDRRRLQRGQTASEAAKMLERMPGVYYAEVYSHVRRAGWFMSTATATVAITMSDGYRVARPAELLNLAVRTAWSMNERKINGSVFVGVYGTDGLPANWDREQALEDNLLGLAGGRIGANGEIQFTNAHMRHWFGGWPADVPEPEDGIFAIERRKARL